MNRQQHIQTLKQNDALSSKRSSVSSVNSATALHGVSEGRSLFFSANYPTVVQPQLLLTASYNPHQGLLSSSLSVQKKPQPPPPPQNAQTSTTQSHSQQNTFHNNTSSNTLQSAQNYSNTNILTSSFNTSSQNVYSSGTRESNASSLVPLYSKSPSSTFHSTSDDDYRSKSSIRNPSVHSTTPLPPVDEDEKDEKSLSLTRKKIFGWSVKKDTSPPPSIPSTKSSREQLRSTPSPKNAAKKPSREFKDFLGIKQQNQKFLAEKVLDQFKNITKPIQQLNSQPVAGSSGGSSGAVGTLPVKISGSKFPMPSVNSEYESESDFSMNENSVNEYMDSITNSSPYSSPDVVIVSRPSDKKSYESILREETTILPTMEKNVPRRIVSLEEFGKSNNVTRIKSTQSNGSSVLPTPPNDTVIPKTPPQFATTTTMTGNSNMQNSQYQNGGYNPYPPHTTSQESFFFDKWNVNIPQRSTSLGRNTSLSSIQNGYKDEKESPTPPVPQVPDHLLQQLSQVRHTRSNTNLQSEQSQQYNSKDRMNGHESSEKKVSSLDRDVSSNKFSSLDRGRFDSNGRKKDSMERGKRMQSLDRLKKAVERTFFEPDPVRDTSPTGMSRQDSRDGKRGLASVWNGWKRKDDVPQNPHTAVESWMPPKSRNPSMPNLKEREKSKGGGKNGTFYMDVAGTTTQNGKGGKGTLSLGRTRERSDIQDDFDEMEKKRGMGKSTFGTLSLGRSRGKSRGENETRDVQEFEEPEQYVSASINANSLSRNGRESRESVTRGNAHSLSRNGRESRESLNKKELRSNRSSERLDGKRREFEGLPMLTTEFGLDFKDMLRIFDK